jgi:hypothetical protein
LNCRLEAEELRYETEYLEWKLQEAAGARYLTPQVTFSWNTSVSSLTYESSYFDELERCIQLKHKAVYPTEQEVSVSLKI